MSKRKKANTWDAVFDRIGIVPGNPEVRYAPRPTAADLDQLESQIGLQLPVDYRALMLRCGPGDLEGVWFFSVAAVAEWTLRSRKVSPRKRRQNSHGEWVSTLVLFANNAASDFFAWDPATVARADPHDCQIYQFDREEGEENPTGVGGSFAEFLRWAEAETNASVFPNETPGSRNLLFMREIQGTKEAPKEKSVKLWLAFNNHAVRDLALSIRDENRPDVFPILADAPEEAGCTNPDMLNSCRTGDPDIDGVWVLRVLLGNDT